MTYLKEFCKKLAEYSELIEDHVYWLDCNLKYLGINPAQSRSSKLGSGDIIGLKNEDLFPKSNYKTNIDKLDKNNFTVLQKKIGVTFEESAIYLGQTVCYYTRKIPIMDDNGKILGLWGHSRDITAIRHSQQDLDNWLSGSLKYLPRSRQSNEINLSNHFLLRKNIKIKLSVREGECIYYMLLGYTAKQMANHLNLSIRTVQHYIENIKIKADCYYKSQLIEAALRGSFYKLIRFP